MKKVLFLFSLVAGTVTLNAQKLSFGVKAGANFSTVKTNDDDFNDERTMRTTYHFGVVTNFTLARSFSLQPQLLLQGKGVSLKHEDHKDKFKFTSLDIPVNFLYNNKGFFVGGGPNLGINLSGKLVAEDDPSENTTFKFGSADDEIKRMNLGVNLLAGYRTSKGIFVSANYLTDFTNWDNSSTDKWRNTLFGISIGYMFK